MTEKICKNCKWWLDADEGNNTCSNFNLGKKADAETNGAYFSSYVMDLLETGPNFGCIHWESKEIL